MVNHIGLLYPIIYYYKWIKNVPKKVMNLSYDLINYRLYNETSMKNNSDSYLLDIDLNQIYCIDMEDLYLEGSWDNEYINYIEFDLYACKDGIDYDENNDNCSTYEKIIEMATEIPLNLNCISLLPIISQ